MSESLRVFAIEPYYGGSHKAFLDSVQRHSRHQWELFTGQPRHWKWRMRSSPLELSQATEHAIRSLGAPDVIVCSSMLDLPTWLGLSARASSTDFTRQAWNVPIAMYFHENQWTYPQSPKARYDAHYGYTNLLSAIAADACWFNSQYHLDSFLQAGESFVAKMPDTRRIHDVAAIRSKSEVIAPGFSSRSDRSQRSRTDNTLPLRIGWVSRWEFDKRPDRFFDLLTRLNDRAIDFRLVLLGNRAENEPSLTSIRNHFAGQILVDQYADSRESYRRHLTQIDVVVSTADHEFFGIAVCEAIDAGAAPVLPNRLSYPELVPDNDRYESIDDAVDQIDALRDPKKRAEAVTTAQQSIRRFQITETVPQLDQAIAQLHQTRSAREHTSSGRRGA
ncbi:MAG: DUF3524 domain-containing protein [Pirellulaceae bacterium]|nr:DUF3524 domain-containing protein [Pirellulaceae bacterium]